MSGLPIALILLPFALQGAALLWDEIVFHRRRGLPLWERLGHPLDTLSIVACLAWAHWQPYGPGTLRIYAALCAFSCLFVTKDEFVHARRCSPAEQWLHSVLFLLHPVSLGAAGLLWARASAGDARASAALASQLALIAIFLAGQAAYWNLPLAREEPRAAGNQ